MGIPRKVREQGERAEKLIKELGQPEIPAPTAESQTVIQPVIEPVQPTAEVQAPPPADPVQPPVDQPIAPVVEPEAETVSMEEYRKLQNSYSSLQGRMRQEVDMRKAEKQVYDEKFNEMNNSIMNLTQRFNSVQQPVQPPPDIASQEEIDTYGKPYIDFQAKVTQKIVGPELQKINERLERNEVQSFFNSCRTINTKFDAINDDPEFVEWLKGSQDGNSGMTKFESLQDAFARRSVNRVMGFFSEWTEMGKGTPPAAPAVPRTNLNSRISPPKGGSGPTPLPPKRIYSPAEYQSICNNIVNRKYTAEDTKKLKIELDLAIAEGRIKAA